MRRSARLPPVCRRIQHSAKPPRKAAKKIGRKGIDYFPRPCYTTPTRGCSSSVELRLPKPIRWVRLPSSAPKENRGPLALCSLLAVAGVECVIAQPGGLCMSRCKHRRIPLFCFPSPARETECKRLPSSAPLGRGQSQCGSGLFPFAFNGLRVFIG